MRIQDILIKISENKLLNYDEQAFLRNWGEEYNAVLSQLANLGGTTQTVTHTQVIHEISQLADDLGTVRAGAFISGDAGDPRVSGSSFTGVAIVYPALESGSDHFNIFGMSAGTITFGLSSETGKIFAYSGVIGGWTLGSTYLRSGSGANTVGLDSGGTNPAIHAGSATPASAPFRVNQDGSMVASSATITGSVTATSGAIAGWTIDTTTIKKLASNIGIILDSSTPAIKVGDTAGTYILLDGANQRIRSSNFVTGRTGFNIDAATGDAEFNNLTARGELRSMLFSSGSQTVFQSKIKLTKDGGQVAAAVGSSDTTINFGKSMTLNDWVVFEGEDANGSLALEWVLVGSNVSGTTYNVTRNVDGSGVNAWAIDTPFATIGKNGDYRIEMIAGATPSVKLIKQGSTWSVSTEEFVVTPADVYIDYGSFFRIKNNGTTLLEISHDGNGNGFLALSPGNFDAGLSMYSRANATYYSLAEIIAESGTKTGLIEVKADSNGVAGHSGFNSVIESTSERHLKKFYDGSTTIRFPGFHYDPLGPLLAWPGLKALWHGAGYDGTGSAVIIPDRTGMSHHLTTAGPPTEGREVNGDFPDIPFLDFDGSTKYAYRATETMLQATNNLDIIFIVKLDTLPSASAFYTLAMNGQSGVNDNLIISAYNSAGTTAFRVDATNSGGTVSVLTSSVTLSAGVWYVVRVQIQTSTLYAITVNGTKTTATAPTSLRTPADYLRIARHYAGTSMLDGKIFAFLWAVNTASDDVYYALWNSIRDYLGV